MLKNCTVDDEAIVLDVPEGIACHDKAAVPLLDDEVSEGGLTKVGYDQLPKDALVT